MKSRSLARFSLALLAVGGTGGIAPALARPWKSTTGYNLTRSVQAAVAQAQIALNANDTATALSDLEVAESRVVKDDDRYVTNLVKYNAAVQAGRIVTTNEAIEVLVAGDRLPAVDKAQLLVAEGQSVRVVDLRKAEAIFARAAALKPDDAEILVTLAAVKAENRKPAEAVALLGR